MSEQARMWAYLPLPAPVEAIGDLSQWMVVEGDPVALLEEALAFIGWGSCPPDLKERIERYVRPMVSMGAEGT